MIYPTLEALECAERALEEAANAEIKQHWYQAAILWRRVGDISNAESCESILQYLAENNLTKLDSRQRQLVSDDLAWRER